ncbi:thioredoxin family protein [Lacipirellula limnantheis]|uniref:thioredoxin family protein n=1 Tax=Lacipirellula limnantheis TaxID=2528024 RepID=UPI0011A7275B|nr:thioredoxin family protein [Lacipirellula limnantheis]
MNIPAPSRRILSPALLIAGVCLLSGCIETVGPDGVPATILDARMVTQRGAITFVKGWDVGRRVAAERRQPALVFFTAHWCTYCRKMEGTTFTDPAVAHLATQFVCVLVDADEEPAVCQRLQLSGYPTLEMFSPTGTSLGRLTGWQGAPALAQSLQAALQRHALLEQPLRR